MNYRQSYIIEPKKFQPICYFDTKQTIFPIQINFFVSDLIEFEKEKENKNKNNNSNQSFFQSIKNFFKKEQFYIEPTIIPNFINYHTRVISHTFNPTTNENYQLNNYTVYYYYFMLYINEDTHCKFKNICNIKSSEETCVYNTSNKFKTKLKCIVVETINNHLNRVLFTPNENSNQYFWYKYYNTSNSVITHTSRNSYNIYPITGKIYRCFGFKNDECDSKIFRKFSLSKLTDTAINSKLFDPFRELLTGNLNNYPIYNDELVKYNHLMKF